MQNFLSRQFGIGRADRVDRNRTARSRRLAPSVDGLESRNLLTGGVSLQAGGVLEIAAPLNSGNTAVVSMDTANNAVKVTLDGTTQEFAASSVSELFYVGGQGGGDTYTNDTAIISCDLGYGGGNTFTGGTGEDVMFMFGDDNTAISGGGLTLAFTEGGANDNIGAGITTFD